MTDLNVVWKFGGGINSATTEDEINEREAAGGFNFDLDLQTRELKNRAGFEKVGTATNAGEIRGFVTLKKGDGTTTMLVQAGDTVYQWDGASTFTSKGTVGATAQLRGRIEHNWLLADKVLITDLNLQEPVMEWDGTTLSDVSFRSTPSTAWTGDFKAKYCYVSNERVFYANIDDNGTALPHMIVGSQRSDYEEISVSDRPSSSLSDGDAFFLLQPDLRVINGLAESFGRVVTSSEEGSIFILEGSSAYTASTGGTPDDGTYRFKELHPRSGATGKEAMIYVGNDIYYGKAGSIESLLSTEKFGDVTADDLSLPIQDQIDSFNDWTLVYNSRFKRVYCFPEGNAELWVMHKPLLGGELSPWSKWVTNHSSDFQITAIMNCFDPSDGLEYTFFGDSSGNIYRIESGLATDDGSNITVERKSKLFTVPLNEEAYAVEGWIKYRRETTPGVDDEAVTVELLFEYNGDNVFNQTINVTIPALSTLTVYSGGAYYGGSYYYGRAFSGRLTRQKIGAAGQFNDLQVQAKITGSTNFTINEIGLQFKA